MILNTVKPSRRFPKHHQRFIIQNDRCRDLNSVTTHEMHKLGLQHLTGSCKCKSSICILHPRMLRPERALELQPGGGDGEGRGGEGLSEAAKERGKRRTLRGSRFVRAAARGGGGGGGRRKEEEKSEREETVWLQSGGTQTLRERGGDTERREGEQADPRLFCPRLFVLDARGNMRQLMLMLCEPPSCLRLPADGKLFVSLQSDAEGWRREEEEEAGRAGSVHFRYRRK